MRALAARLVAGWRCDLVFNIAEGVAGFGRESQVPALLEAYGIPYTFSDPLVCALTLHKGMAKHVARGCGVPTPSFALVTSTGRKPQSRHVAVAAVREARRRGQQQGRHGEVARRPRRAALVEVCTELLEQYRQPVLVEEYLSGREFTVGILGTGDCRAGPRDAGGRAARGRRRGRLLVSQQDAVGEHRRVRAARGRARCAARSRASRSRLGRASAVAMRAASTFGSTVRVGRR